MKLYFSILLAFVIVGVQSYLINEYRHSTRDIEILNPHSTVVPNMYYVVVYDKDKDLVSSESLVGLQPGAMKIVHFLLKPQQDGQLLILIYKSLTDMFSYADINIGGFIIDSFVYLPNAIDESIFGDKVSSWDSAVSQSYGPTISRCFSGARKLPQFFIATADTINSPNDCINFPPIPSAGGDPHFVQGVIDKNSNKFIDICYDVSGDSQQSVYIFEDKSINTIVNCVLLDDFYFHKVIIDHEENVIEINTHSIILDSTKHPWRDNLMIYLEDAEILCRENKVKIEFYIRNTVVLSVNILKSRNKLGFENLDIEFKEIDMEKEKNRFGGLFGDIQQKIFSLKERKNNEITVNVNGRDIIGKFEKRLSRNCIFLPFKELIKPKEIKYYIH